MKRVILVDVNPVTRAELSEMLTGAGYEPAAFGCWRCAREAMRDRRPQVVILTDWRTTGGRGAYRRLRHPAQGAPFVLVGDGGVTEWDERFASVVSYPVSRERLLAALAEVVQTHDVVVEHAEYRLERRAQRLHCRGRSVVLTPVQTEILAALLQAQGELVPADTLAKAVWPDQGKEDRRSLYTHVSWLRARLSAGGLPGTIENVRGRGYRFVDCPAESPSAARADE